MSDPWLGKVINGKFRILAAIGKGGMGKVYRAEQLPLGRTVAVKVLHRRLLDADQDADPQFQRRFFLEASLCSKVSHPNVVTIYDYGRVEDQEEEAYFMAMEYLEGQTLHERLRYREVLAPREAIAVVLDIARGLREAHRAGLIHRDLKPGNVMIVPDPEAGERAVILDFGLVKQVESENHEELTQEGSFLGSPKYMSPEQIEHGDVDHRTDLYSLGVILFQCLAGRVPYDESSSMKTLLAHVQKPVPAIRDRNPSVDPPPELEAVARKLMAKTAAERFLSAEELIATLREIRGSLGFSGPATSSGSLTGPLGDKKKAPDATLTAMGAAPIEPSGSLVASRQALAEPQRNRAPLLYALAGAGALALLGLGVAALRGRPGSAEVPPHAGHSNPEPARATLTIESTPAGATVTEQGLVLGVTPLRVSLDPSATATREFELRHQGYAPSTLRQAPSRSDVHLVASLVAEAAPPPPVPAVAPPAVAPPPVAPAPPPPPRANPPAVRGGRERPPPPPAVPHPPPPGDDIRTTR